MPGRLSSRRLPARAVALLALLAGAACLTGCSTRRVLTIDSRPSGARIWIDGVLQPTPTPVEIEFVHVRRFELRLEKPGYRSVAAEHEIKGTIADYPFVDLFFETTTRERRYRHVVPLTPLPEVPSDEDVQAVMRRAEAFRERTHREVEAADPPERILPSTRVLP